MKPTNPDGSPLEILNFVRIVHWSGDDLKTLEAWTGYEWSRRSVGTISAWLNVRDLIIDVDKVGQETRWGSPITRDSNTGVEVMSTTDRNTSHLPAGERIGQVAIERHHGSKATDPIYFNVHLWNGFGWVNVGPGHFSDEKTATLFANDLTGKFDEASDGGLCHMGHEFACRRCGVTRTAAGMPTDSIRTLLKPKLAPNALDNETPETVTAIRCLMNGTTMEGAFRIVSSGNGHASVERFQWSSPLPECEPGLWPICRFASEAEAETAILQYGHRAGQTVTLIRNDGAEIVSVAPGAGSFPREHIADELFSRDQVRALANTMMEFQVAWGPPASIDLTAEPVPEQGTLRIRPDLIDPLRKWIIYRWDDTARSWIPAPGFAPCETYWSAVNTVNDSPLIPRPVRLWHPTQLDLDRWARQGFMLSPPGGAHTPEQIEEATRQILDPVTILPPAASFPPVVGACEMRPGDMPGDCWNVVTWNGHTWRQIAENVSKRTAETVVTAVKNNPEPPSIKATVIKEYRKVIQRTRDNLSHLRRIVEANPNDTKDILSKINQIIDEINENNH
jgi:hypothetical protein